MSVCQSDGVSFVVPELWQVTRESQGNDVTFHLQTPGASFGLLTLLGDKPTAREALQAVVQAYEESYDDIDLYEGPDSVLDGPTAECELEFVCLDLVTTVVVRSETTTEFTVVLVYQGEDRELDQFRSLFEQLASSLKYLGDIDPEAPPSSSRHTGHEHDRSHDHDHDHGGCEGRHHD